MQIDKPLLKAGAFIAIIAVLFLYKPGKAPEGNLLLTVSDPSVDIAGVKNLYITVDQITLDDIVISTEQKIYDLLHLRDTGERQVLAVRTVPPNSYNRVKLQVSSASVTMVDGSNVPVKVPSGEVKFTGPIIVESGNVTIIDFDFNAAESLHLVQTGADKYILRPVVITEVRNGAKARIGGNTAELTGGTTTGLTQAANQGGY